MVGMRTRRRKLEPVSPPSSPDPEIDEKEAKRILEAQRADLAHCGHVNLSDEVLPGISRAKLSFIVFRKRLTAQ